MICKASQHLSIASQDIGPSMNVQEYTKTQTHNTKALADTLPWNDKHLIAKFWIQKFQVNMKRGPTVDGRNPANQDVKNPVNNGMNYQPQLVNAGFLNHQPYETWTSKSLVKAKVPQTFTLQEIFSRGFCW